MKLAQLFPIRNEAINVSLIENVFGGNFVVTDTSGSMLTTAKNVKLLGRVKRLIGVELVHDAHGFSCTIAALRAEADVLLQSDYERAIREERNSIISSGIDFPILIGSLG